MSKTMLLNANWRFHLGDDSTADFMGYDDSAWRLVTLPHDWSVEKNKMICALLTTVMVLSFAACGSQGNAAASAESTVTSESGAE